jgi:hypothetical protein
MLSPNIAVMLMHNLRKHRRAARGFVDRVCRKTSDSEDRRRENG